MVVKVGSRTVCFIGNDGHTGICTHHYSGEHLYGYCHTCGFPERMKDRLDEFSYIAWDSEMIKTTDERVSNKDLAALLAKAFDDSLYEYMDVALDLMTQKPPPLRIELVDLREETTEKFLVKVLEEYR